MATKLPFTGTFEVICLYLQKGTLWKSGIHQGIDLRSENKNVYSICNGVVERAGYDNGGFGNYVRIKEDNSENRIYLAHLDKIYVKVGQKVTYTTIVGLMGNTGNSTTPHTHVEIREFKNGVAVKKLNPANYMGIPNKKGTYNSKDYQINTSSSNAYLSNTGYKGTSIVEALNEINVNSSYSHRKELAIKNGISNYTGTASQNTELLNLLKNGKLIK